MTSRVVVILVLKAPGRCTLAFSRQVTEPKSHCMDGGAFDGILKDIGYVYVPENKNKSIYQQTNRQPNEK